MAHVATQPSVEEAVDAPSTGEKGVEFKSVSIRDAPLIISTHADGTEAPIHFELRVVARMAQGVTDGDNNNEQASKRNKGVPNTSSSLTTPPPLLITGQATLHNSFESSACKNRHPLKGPGENADMSNHGVFEGNTPKLLL